MFRVGGTLAVLCLLALHGTEAAGFWCPRWCCPGYPKPEADVRPYPQDCGYPPDGWWHAKHNYPTGPCRSELVYQAYSRVYLKRTFGDVYVGSGMGGLVQSPPFIGERAFSALAIYNNMSCVMHGAIEDFPLTINDVTAWVYDKKAQTMAGHYLNCGYGANLMYKTRAFHDLVYAEDQTVPIPDDIKDVKPHSEYEAESGGGVEPPLEPIAPAEPQAPAVPPITELS